MNEHPVPTDLEAAALALIVAMPAATLGSTTITPLLLQDFADQLAEERVFAGLSWPDAENVAKAICAELLTGTGSVADRLRNRARDALAGTDGPYVIGDRVRHAEGTRTGAVIDGGVGIAFVQWDDGARFWLNTNKLIGDTWVDRQRVANAFTIAAALLP